MRKRQAKFFTKQAIKQDAEQTVIEALQRQARERDLIVRDAADKAAELELTLRELELDSREAENEIDPDLGLSSLDLNMPGVAVRIPELDEIPEVGFEDEDEYAEGYDNGFDDGFDEGHKEGYESGWAAACRPSLLRRILGFRLF